MHSALLDEAAFQQKVAIDRENELHEALRRERAEREADKDRHRAQQQTSRMATPPRPTRPVSDDKDRGAPGLLTPGAVRSLSGGKGNQRGHVERAGSDRARTRRTPFASPSPSFASRLDQTELSADENPKAPNGESLTPEAATFSRLYKRHLARYGALTSSDAVDVAVQVYLTGVAEQYHTSASQGRGAKSSNRRSLAAVCADVRAFLPPEVRCLLRSWIVFVLVCSLLRNVNPVCARAGSGQRTRQVGVCVYCPARCFRCAASANRVRTTPTKSRKSSARRRA